jgi:translation initiation factor 2B subunit (eIF-2B alpha/beta/delta family)
MPEEIPNRAFDWIESQEYKDRLIKIEEYNRRLTEGQGISYFTPHDATHCIAVENMVKDLINTTGINLTDLEKFILFCAVWTHDLGMFPKIQGKFCEAQKIPNEMRSTENLRDIHDQISAWYLLNYSDEIMKISADESEDEIIVKNALTNYARTISSISRFHRMKYDINECKSDRFLKGEKVRTQALACYLRLGDTLHVDSTRFNRSLFDVLQIGQLDRSARLHWIKSYVVSNIYLDPLNETITVNIDLPDLGFSPGKDKDDWTESVRSIESAIIGDIYADVLAVREIFKREGLRAYSLVKPNTTYIQGYSKEDIEEIRGVISDLGIVFSPNTSKVIEKTMDSITSLCRIEFERSDVFYNQMTLLFSYLDRVHDSRPCHVGLSKVTENARKIFHFYYPDARVDHAAIPKSHIDECRQAIRAKIEELNDERKNFKEEIRSLCREPLLENIENIILFGFSEMVKDFLVSYGKEHPSWKEKLKIFVLECAGKRRLSSNNKIEYNDGVHYAIQLSKCNFKRISLIPDVSMGSLAYYLSLKEKIDRTLVLFGVNGIDQETFDFGHNSGHLMVAILAKYFGIKVDVVTDSFKLGKIDWKPRAIRRTPWLTGEDDIVSELKRHNIELINCLEDRIPTHLVADIISDKMLVEKARNIIEPSSR